MRVTLTLDKESVTADLDPHLVGDLYALLGGKTVQEADVVRLLRQVSYFDNNKDDIVSKYPGQAVVIGHETVVFAGTFDEAFEWTSANLEARPVYIVATTAPEAASSAMLKAMDLMAISR
ncbi:hypothetical protein D9753_16095 [Streptomyces dangxiongensis]|uniref:Uncharacterized protein n=1 Tax=Streptomyces dangxiongensis TaxID=1442032 RepID=A0A3G2JFN8_9ACTN|nr:hypothetical protein [Streptomyces dangxiongensis]AYN40185.1 hypothetical protein D9753_16095 [Streptomyces dangxiongensis]